MVSEVQVPRVPRALLKDQVMLGHRKDFISAWEPS